MAERSVHEGHRERLRNKFLTNGFESFEDHEIIELLLFYAIPRGNTNPIAHDLINRFGNLRGVLDATPEELEGIKGLGSAGVTFFKVMISALKEYELSIKLTDERKKIDDKLNKQNSPYLLLANTFYTESLDNQYKARQDFLMKRVVLEQMVGAEALNEIENKKDKTTENKN